MVNASFGMALGFDKETPGLMSGHPRPGEPVLSLPVMITAGGVGLVITIGLLSLIRYGAPVFGGAHRPIHGVYVICLLPDRGRFRMPIGEGHHLTTDTFDSRQMNRVALVQIVLAVLVTQLNSCASFWTRRLSAWLNTPGPWSLRSRCCCCGNSAN